MKNLNDNYNVGAYVRLSREDDQNDESKSIKSQKMIIESFANFNNLKISKFYSDDGYTGSNFNRPAFEQLKADIEDGVINCVIVKDLSRLGRELYETGGYIEEYFLSKGIRFIAINDSYDSFVGDSMLGIRLSVNDLYLRDLSKKVKAGFDAKRNRGDYVGSLPAFGYKKNPKNNKHLIIDEVASEYVRMMFAYALEGLGTSKIARKLTDTNIPTPVTYKKEKRSVVNKALLEKGDIWRPATVKSILENELYLGHMVQGKWKKVSYSSKKLVKMPRSEWFIVKNTHEPIIDEETFQKVQIYLEKNKRFAAKNTEKYLLQGLIVCKDCGSSMSIHNVKRNQKKGAQCNNYQKFGKHGVCSSHHIDYNALELDILHYLKEIGEQLVNKFDSESSCDAIVRLQMKEHHQIDNQIAELEKNNNKIIRTLEKLYEDRLNDIISIKQYTLLAKRYDDESNEILNQIALLKQQLDNLNGENLVKIYERTKRAIHKFISLEDLTRELLQDVIKKIEVDKKRNIVVFFNTDLSSLTKH